MWNYNELTRNLFSRGAKEVDILTSMDGINFTLLESTEFGIAPGRNDVDFSEFFMLDAIARYIKLDIHSNHGDGQYTGLSEVKFFGTVVVPEPATVTLAAIGLGGLMVRRRRRARS